VVFRANRNKEPVRRCTTRAIRGTTALKTPADARASLTRHGRLYASGTASRSQGLSLRTRRSVPAGSYTLTLRYRRAQRSITTTTKITIS
jgi:hypothetical protein